MTNRIGHHAIEKIPIGNSKEDHLAVIAAQRDEVKTTGHMNTKASSHRGSNAMSGAISLIVQIQLASAVNRHEGPKSL
jgi:hypothetical protein